MKKAIFLIAAIFAMGIASAQGNHDWANYGRYSEANASLKSRIEAGSEQRPDVVFMGNSITQGWADGHPNFFTDNNFVGRGIGGQVTAQMLARFRADVLELEPRAVVILAGTNDIAHNQGFVTIENIAGNIFSMADLAKVHGIEVVLCSVLPAAEYPWRPEITDVADKVQELNRLLRSWAADNECTYVDFWTPMADERGGLSKELAIDGIHPTSAGYDLMEAVIIRILRSE